MPIWQGVVVPENFLHMTRPTIGELAESGVAPGDLAFARVGVFNESRLAITVRDFGSPFKSHVGDIFIQRSEHVDSQGRSSQPALAVHTDAGIVTVSGGVLAQESPSESAAPTALANESKLSTPRHEVRVSEESYYYPDVEPRPFYQSGASAGGAAASAVYQDISGQQTPASLPSQPTQTYQPPPTPSQPAPEVPDEDYYGSIGDYLGLGYPGVGTGAGVNLG